MSFLNCSNLTQTGKIKDANLDSIVLMVFLSCIPFVTIAGNVLVIHIVLKEHKFRQKANVFVVSLAMTDIAVAIFVMSFSILKQFGDMNWLSNKYVCLLSFSFDVMLTSSSILHLMCMTVDRFIAICNPFKYHRLMSVRSVTALLVVCWTLPLLMSFGLIFTEIHSIGVETHDIDCNPKCLLRVNIYYAVICSGIIFYIPSVYMLVCNVKIFRKVRDQGRQLCKISNTNLQEHQDMLSKREIKVARTIAIMLSCFFLCWLPFFVMNIIDPLTDYKINKTTFLIITWLGYINSTVNPYLYYFLNKSSNCTTFFQRKFSVLNCCRTRKNVCVQEHLNRMGNTFLVYSEQPKVSPKSFTNIKSTSN